MRRAGILSMVLAVGIVLLGSDGFAQHSIEDRWSNPDYERREFTRFVVVGISADNAVRKNFENKFVSFLRGKDAEGVPSYTLAPNLAHPPSRDYLLGQIEEMKIEAALSVRVVPLAGKTGESDWAAAWSEQVAGDQGLRELVQATLPLAGTKASKFGVEVTLWDARDSTRVWGIRTGSYSRKQLQKNTGEFVLMVMRALKWDEWM